MTSANKTQEALYYVKREDGSVRCELCPHYCLLRENALGVCGVRQNIEGKLYSLIYGKASSVAVDPIEKKPLFHFFPGSRIFSLGTLGCNFRCANCQNYDISQIYGSKGVVEEYEKVNWGEDLSPAELVEQAKANNCQSIAYTYTEPTVFLEYALDTMKLAKKEGLRNVWVSNGFMSDQALDAIIPYLDAINVDIKSFDDGFYQKNCGARVQPVLDNCKRLVKECVCLETTTLIIPTLSDDEQMLSQVAKFIKNELGDFVPWHVSAFSGLISWKLKQLPDTPISKVKRAYEIGKEEGLKYVYTGNVWEEESESTYCPKCKNTLIERIGYRVTRKDEAGQCPKCQEKLEGLF